MGASSSTPSGAGEAFTERYAALPDGVHKAVEALCAKGDTRLLTAHPSAPSPFPAVPVGVVVRLSHETASAALACVPRLQRKHYELIPKHLTELDFFISFFSHLTAIVDSQCAGAMCIVALSVFIHLDPLVPSGRLVVGRAINESV